MTDGSVLLVLMGLILAVFVWAVRRGGPLPQDVYRMILLVCAVAGTSTASGSAQGGNCDGGGHG